VKPPEFDYDAPESLDEALALLHEMDDAKVLAGGQSLIPLLNFRLAAPALLVDLGRVPGLADIDRGNGAVRIGAMVRQRAAESSPLLAEAAPLVREALRNVAHPQIRSRGTVGGSIAHADPAAELPALLVALDGRVRLESVEGGRWIDAADLYTGYLETSLRPDEVVTAVELPVASARTGAACVELVRRSGDYALCGALVQVSRSVEGALEDVRVALLGVGRRPQRASAVEEAMRSGTAPERAAALAADGLDPPDDAQASGAFRKHLARVLVRRGLELALERSA
jgi:carbon-monoxide dehydrogenase medium subunit